MVDNETTMKLRAMKLSGIAECLENLASVPNAAGYTTSDVIKMAVDHEWDRRRNSKLKRLQKKASLAQPYADMADIRLVADRVIDTDLMGRLTIGNYLMRHQDVVLQGPTGSGKTFVACALANKACQQFHNVLYLDATELFDRLTLGERNGERKRVLDQLVKAELLVIDDWFLSRPTNDQVRQLHVLIDRRHRQASTIFCTQLAPDEWHDQMEEKVLADAIVDRIVSNAYMTTLDCRDSLRRIFNSMDEACDS